MKKVGTIALIQGESSIILAATRFLLKTMISIHFIEMGRNSVWPRTQGREPECCGPGDRAQAQPTTPPKVHPGVCG